MTNTDMLAPFSLSGRIVLVTGGTGGIGRACVERLHRYGATVAFTCVEKIEDPVAALESFKLPNLTVHPLDLRSIASIRRCIASVIDAHGRLDILLNNAAVGSATVTEFADSSAEQDSMMLSINADGTLKMCQEFLSLPEGVNRKLINVSSVGGGISAFPGFRLSDGMSKAAVAFLTRQLAAETVYKDVDVFAICPGATNTSMFQASTLDKMSTGKRSNFCAHLPKRRLIEPEEIASVVHFLATPASRVMHGAIIDASMGLGSRPGLQTEFENL